MEDAHSWITFNGFSPHIAVLCAVTLCLLCVSALVSGAETSFFSLSHNDIRHLQSRRSASAAAMLRLLANVDLLLATILVVNNLVNICIVILTAGIIDSVFTFLRFEFLFKT
ncbi:CNNM domain-containing protein, partial [Alistipes shahii]